MKVAVLRLLIFILGSIPVRVRQGLGSFLGHVVALLPLHERRLIELQSKAFLPESGITAARVFGSCASTLLESINLTPLLKDGGTRIFCEDWELIRSLLKQQNGLLALTAHYGNWELLAAYMAHNGVPLTVVGREANSTALQPILHSIRDSHGIKTIWRKGSGLAKELVRDFRSGRVVAALIDQDTRVQSTPVDFLGHPAQTPSSLIRLAKRSKAKIVSAFLMRTDKGEFVIKVREIDESLPEIDILSTFHRHLEEQIKLAPNQWVWFHRRWRTTPEGERRKNIDYIAWLQKKTTEKK